MLVHQYCKSRLRPKKPCPCLPIALAGESIALAKFGAGLYKHCSCPGSVSEFPFLVISLLTLLPLPALKVFVDRSKLSFVIFFSTEHTLDVTKLYLLFRRSGTQLSLNSVLWIDTMTTLDLLPATTYKPPSSVQVHRQRRSLNTIMEDDEDSTRGSIIEVRRGRDRSPKADWLSPLSDHFPTPRGNHFMSAPIPYSSASSDSESDSPAPSSAPWTRDSYTTNATEFDDLYDVSSDEDSRQKTSTCRNSNRQTIKSNRSSAGSTASRRASLPALVIPAGGDPWPGVAAFKQLASPCLPHLHQRYRYHPRYIHTFSLKRSSLPLHLLPSMAVLPRSRWRSCLLHRHRMLEMRAIVKTAGVTEFNYNPLQWLHYRHFRVGTIFMNSRRNK